MARERGGVFERGTRPHFSRCRNLFSFLFPFFFFLYKSTRREKMRIECRKQTHRYFIPPPFTFRIGTPHHFLPVCVTYWRGERESSKKLSQELKIKYYFLFEEDPTKSTPLSPPPCDLHTVHFSSNTIRLF
jgi:hypothetical protein